MGWGLNAEMIDKYEGGVVNAQFRIEWLSYGWQSSPVWSPGTNFLGPSPGGRKTPKLLQDRKGFSCRAGAIVTHGF